MAFLINSNVIISDARELVGVNTAGINTALYVGDNIVADAGSGIITATSFRGDGSQLTGVGLTNTADYEIRNLQAGIVTATEYFGDGSGLTNMPGLNWVSVGEQTTRPDGTALQEGDIYYDSDSLRQFTRFDNSGNPVWVDSNPAANSALGYSNGISTGAVIPGSEVLLFSSAADANVAIGIDTTTDTLTFGLESEVAIAGSMTAGSYYGDGSNLTGVGLGADSDVITTGNIQAGIITATTSLEATAAGVGLTVTSESYFAGPATFQAAAELKGGLIDNQGRLFLGVTVSNDAEVDSPTNLTLATPATAEVIAENVVGAALSTTSELDVNSIQAGIITATTAFEATAASGVGLTVTSDAWIGGNLTVIGDVEANDVNTTSDVTKKENISIIEGALEKVAQLKGVTFDWKSTGHSSGGIIAQDVEKVLPSLVKEGEDHKTVIYNGIVGLLVEAVKELVAEVEELKQNN